MLKFNSNSAIEKLYFKGQGLLYRFRYYFLKMAFYLFTRTAPAPGYCASGATQGVGDAVP